MDRFSLAVLFAFVACVTASATETSLKNIDPAFNDIKVYIAIPLFISGPLMCFFGLKLLKVVIFLAGFIPGAVLSFSIYTTSTDQTTSNIMIGIVIGLAVGIICGLIAICCVKVAIFLTGFAAGATLTVGLLSFVFGIDPSNSVVGIIAFIVGIVAGIVTIWVWEKAIILLTSFMGASEIISAIVFAFEANLDMDSLPTIRKLIYLAVFAIFFIAGFWYQNKTKPAKADGKGDPAAVYVNVPQGGMYQAPGTYTN